MKLRPCSRVSARWRSAAAHAGRGCGSARSRSLLRVVGTCYFRAHGTSPRPGRFVHRSGRRHWLRVERRQRARVRRRQERVRPGRGRGDRGSGGQGPPRARGALPRRARRGLLQDGPHPGLDPAARGGLRQRVRAARAAAAPPLQPRGLLRRLRLRREPRRGPAPPREGHPRGHPERGMAGLDRRGLPDPVGLRAVSFLRNPVFQLVLRIALGGFFVYASLDKIANPAAFAKIVYQWQVFGPVPSNLVAIVLPWVELLSGIALVVGLWKREAALVIALMLVVFLGAAGSVMARGIDVEK